MAQATKTMRAFGLKGFDDPAGVIDLPIPEPGPNEILVRVKAASLNAFDAAVAAGFLKDFMEYRFPVVVGKDFAGVVERVGEGMASYRPGDEVVGLTPPEGHLQRGTLAEYVVVPADSEFVAAKPSNLSFTDAAAFGLAATTAQAAVDAIDPAEGAVVLVVGATGGVGTFAVQITSARGAKVLATGLPQDEDLLRGLGATEVLDFGGDVVAAVRERHPDGIDGLIDSFDRDPQTFAALTELVREGGRVATSLGAADVEALASRGVTGFNVNGQGDPSAFSRVLEAASQGKLRAAVTRVVSLDEVPNVLAQFSTGGVRGKICVSFGD